MHVDVYRNVIINRNTDYKNNDQKQLVQSLLNISSSSDRVQEQNAYVDLWIKTEMYKEVTPKRIYLNQYHPESSYFGDACVFTDSLSTDLDALIIDEEDDIDTLLSYENSQQMWIYSMTSPYKCIQNKDIIDRVDWTMSYRYDSHISIASKWTLNDNIDIKKHSDYFSGKTKSVAWYSESCSNEKRRKYIEDLETYIDIDIYGECGNQICEDGKEACLEKISQHYLFYLSFEYENCMDYISELFRKDGLE